VASASRAGLVLHEVREFLLRRGPRDPSCACMAVVDPATSANNALVTAIAVKPELRDTLRDGLGSQPLDDEITAVALDEALRTTRAEPDTKE
jgi:hypothetical protein